VDKKICKKHYTQLCAKKTSILWINIFKKKLVILFLLRIGMVIREDKVDSFRYIE